jgi:hypothetical protein
MPSDLRMHIIRIRLIADGCHPVVYSSRLLPSGYHSFVTIVH